LYYFRQVVAAKHNFTRYARQYFPLYIFFNSFEYRKIFCCSSIGAKIWFYERLLPYMEVKSKILNPDWLLSPFSFSSIFPAQTFASFHCASPKG
jgi:hypothetical protein